jgi:hypothetical protein
MWKCLAFQDALLHVCGSVDSSSVKNIVAFGDSITDREAVIDVTRCWTRVQLKNVKFMAQPTVKQLCRQLEWTSHCFQLLTTLNDPLNLELNVQPEESLPSSAVAPQQDIDGDQPD